MSVRGPVLRVTPIEHCFAMCKVLRLPNGKVFVEDVARAVPGEKELDRFQLDRTKRLISMGQQASMVAVDGAPWPSAIAGVWISDGCGRRYGGISREI